MPIERKILLSILLLFSMALASYLLYTEFYIKYSDNLLKINKYEHLVSNYDTKETNNNYNGLNKLTDRNDKYNAYFFDEKNADPTILTPYIKNLLLDNGIVITQYRASITSVTFSIKGDKENLLKFFYRINQEDKAYDIPLLNIRMIDNNIFQGTLEISRLVLNETPNIDFLSTNLKKIKDPIPYDKRSVTSFGTSFYTKPNVVAKSQQYVPIEIIRVPTDKFYYIGILRRNDMVVTMFKETYNGRIYRFTNGEIISGWKYIGKEDNYFIFEKGGTIYEVEQ